MLCIALRTNVADVDNLTIWRSKVILNYVLFLDSRPRGCDGAVETMRVARQVERQGF